MERRSRIESRCHPSTSYLYRRRGERGAAGRGREISPTHPCLPVFLHSCIGGVGGLTRAVTCERATIGKEVRLWWVLEAIAPRAVTARSGTRRRARLGLNTWLQAQIGARPDDSIRRISRVTRRAVKVVRSHSLGEFWNSALHKSMSAKAPGAGEGGERMDNGGARQRN